MAVTTYPSLDAFYRDRPERGMSGEADYGVHWRVGTRWPRWRVSYIQATGEVHAFCQSDGRVRVLGVVPADPDGCYYRTLDQVLDGWADGNHGWQLAWVKEKLAAYQPAPAEGTRAPA